MVTRKGTTRASILDASVDLFGAKGFAAVSLDEIASAVGVAKQTVLYWFASKDELIDAVLAQTAGELAAIMEAAIRSAPNEPLARIESVIKAVFRPAVRRPGLLGLIREVSRLEPQHASRLRANVQPYARRITAYLPAEMDRGRLRRGDPGLLLSLAYATITGIATEREVLRAVEWPASTVGLRHLRDELTSFVLAALRPL